MDFKGLMMDFNAIKKMVAYCFTAIFMARNWRHAVDHALDHALNYNQLRSLKFEYCRNISIN